MGQREKHPELQKLFDAGIPVYSFSKLETINNCLLAAYKQYVLHESGSGNIYSYMGTKVHDTLEAIMNGKATEADLLPALHEELEDMDMAGVEFPKDRDGNDTLRSNWLNDMEHFCKTYKRPKDDLKNFSTEDFFLYKSPAGHYLQGYIDLQHTLKDGSIAIYDYKTSSIYSSAADLQSHGRQLILYALGMQQAGKTVKSVAWIFTKYIDATFFAKKTAKSKEKTWIERTIERRKIGWELSKYVIADLTEAGFDDLDIEAIIDKFRASNDFNDLPEEIRGNYKMKPCVKQYELTEETIHECEEYIDATIAKWEALSGDEDDYPHRSFTKIQKNGKEVMDTWFCVSLCNFKNCADVHDYLDQQKGNSSDEDEDMFA